MNEKVELSRPPRWIASVLFWVFIVYLATVVFEGPLRYALSMVGLGSLIYLRDVAMVLAIIAGMLLSFVQNKSIITPVSVATYFLLIYFFIGLLLGEGSIFSALFGLKIFAVFLFGMALSSAVKDRNRIFARVISIFLFFSVVGVAVNFVVGKYPWEGMLFETSFGVTSTTKEWWTEGGRRLPGFARASFDAAMIIGVCFAFLLPVLSRARAIVFGCLCLLAVYLTTSKGMIMAMGIVTFWWSLVPASDRKKAGTFIAFGLLSLMLLLPVISCLIDVGPRFIGEVPRAFSSFAERIADMWPRSCSILQTPQSWLLGAGIGSIGVPQQYSWLSKGYSSADNLFVYLYVNGGLLWAFALVVTVFVGLRRDRTGYFIDDSRVRSLMIVMLGYGVTTNMQEQAFYSAIAGVLVAQVWNGDFERRLI